MRTSTAGSSSAQSLVFVSWLSSGSPNGSRRAGLIQRTPSNCISTFAWMTRIKPSRSSGRLAPLVRQVSLRQGSGSSSTPSGIHSASSSVATAQAEPSSAHAARRLIANQGYEGSAEATGARAGCRHIAAEDRVRVGVDCLRSQAARRARNRDFCASPVGRSRAGGIVSYSQGALK
jgi:hypothetical protein